MDGKLWTQFMTGVITSPEQQKIYFGLAEGKWKKRYYNHDKSFNHKQYSHGITLSSYVWHVKETL